MRSKAKAGVSKGGSGDGRCHQNGFSVGWEGDNAKFPRSGCQPQGEKRCDENAGASLFQKRHPEEVEIANPKSNQVDDYVLNRCWIIEKFPATSQVRGGVSTVFSLHSAGLGLTRPIVITLSLMF